MTSSRPIKWGILSTARIGRHRLHPLGPRHARCPSLCHSQPQPSHRRRLCPRPRYSRGAGQLPSPARPPGHRRHLYLAAQFAARRMDHQSRRGGQTRLLRKTASRHLRPKAGKWSRLAARPTCCSLRLLSSCTIPKAAASRKSSRRVRSALCATLTPA